MDFRLVEFKNHILVWIIYYNTKIEVNTSYTRISIYFIKNRFISMILIWVIGLFRVSRFCKN